MISLNWHEKSSAPDSIRPVPGATNLWFGVAMGLMGLIGGFVIGMAMNLGQPTRAATTNFVAQAPAAPRPATAPQAPKPSAQPPAAIDPKTDRIRGDIGKAEVAFIEYSDFECPFCKRHFATTQQVISTYGDKVAFVYRDYPLNFHQNAHKEAEAGQCVFALGGNDAFWKYHDYVFTNTASNGTGFALDQLPVAAAQTGVDAAKFKACLDGGTYARAVDDQEAEGQGAGVTGTPGNFVINLKTQKSTTIKGAVPFDAIKTAIDAALNG